MAVGEQVTWGAAEHREYQAVRARKKWPLRNGLDQCPYCLRMVARTKDGLRQHKNTEGKWCL